MTLSELQATIEEYIKYGHGNKDVKISFGGVRIQSCVGLRITNAFGAKEIIILDAGSEMHL